MKSRSKTGLRRKSKASIKMERTRLIGLVREQEMAARMDRTGDADGRHARRIAELQVGIGRATRALEEDGN